MENNELFEKDGFTMSVTTKFEGHEVTFTQWEAKCFNELTYENEHLKKLVSHLRSELHSERDRYIRLLCKGMGGDDD